MVDGETGEGGGRGEGCEYRVNRLEERGVERTCFRLGCSDGLQAGAAGAAHAFVAHPRGDAADAPLQRCYSE